MEGRGGWGGKDSPACTVSAHYILKGIKSGMPVSFQIFTKIKKLASLY